MSWRTVEQGAATSVLLATSPLVEGRYFEDCNEAGPHPPGVRRGVAACATDPTTPPAFGRPHSPISSSRSAARC
ncbi:hypothetical protein AB4305_20210 [Nocardia sp. 2YAB30]|uniref:hypothetical protein n=1 Tax=unclassified Nocardia TaxID=2637762 RepID=UPI003F9B59F4